ncbi:MAG TPA: NAD(P)/FAD-dependent oxidoreductase [Thermomicrobiales bacterium]|nr:NAD(P)/FAD-dependent oxidoreductase [Thermomicrobiales bacterium]
MTDSTTDNSATDHPQVEQFVTEAATFAPNVATRGKPHVVIIGGGFAGLNAAKRLADAPVKVTVIDRRNHHLFAPLLYQVATAQLSPANIAQPIRGILRGQKNASVILAEVEGINVADRRVTLDDGTVMAYDYLIVAVGATHSYFGRDEWAPMAPGLKTLDDAVAIRSKILMAFEAAEREADPARRAQLLTFIVIGGGPTGVEMAGAIGEIAKRTLVNEFKNFDPREARILLLEGLPRILPMFPEELSAAAAADLGVFGVEVRTGSLVTAIDEQGVNIGEERIDSATVIWAAGVQVSDLTKVLREIAELDRAGRVQVERELHIPGRPDIFVVGDAAGVKTAEGKPIPGIAPAAMQQGRWAAENILRAVDGQAYTPFQYSDKGSLATIGRNQAVASVRGKNFSGFPAWLLWMVVHVFYLNGLANRAFVIAQWIMSYFRFGRNSRLIQGDIPRKLKS